MSFVTKLPLKIFHGTTWLIGAIVLSPILLLFGAWATVDTDLWQHLYRYQLGDTVFNSFMLVITVVIGAGSLGTTLAWLVTRYSFPAVGFFRWALMMPLALPSYVIGFSYLSLLGQTGSISLWFQETFTFQLLTLKGQVGLTFILIIALYPYVYLLARQAFVTLAGRSIEVGQMLGLNRWQSFRRVTLPLSRPWLVGGMLLVGMETLADFGTASIFNVDVFTTTIYKVWFGLFSPQTAAQLSSLLVLIIALILLQEKFLYGKGRYQFTKTTIQPIQPVKLHGLKKGVAVGIVSFVLVLAFVIPVTAMIILMDNETWQQINIYLGRIALTSLGLVITGAFIITIIAIIMASAQRLFSNTITKNMIKLSTLGYAVPGTVLAVGVFMASIHISFIQGTLILMFLAYTVRFLNVAFQPTRSSWQRLLAHHEDIAKINNISGLRLWRLVYLPVLKPGLITAWVLVSLDLLKEMPITLMTRPFGFDTLAVKIFEFTSEGQWGQASFYGLAIVLLTFIPTMILGYAQKNYDR